MNQAIEQLESDLKAERQEPQATSNIVNMFDFPILSDDEIAARQAELEQQERDNRLAEIREYRMIPDEFLEPVDRRFKTVDWHAFDRVQSWDGKSSMTIRGISGLGKSRAVYNVLKREFIENGRDFHVYNESKILAKIASAQMSGKLDKLLSKWANAEILFLDDFDKVNFSNGVTGQNAMTIIFGVIKDRCAWKKPTILAYNLTLDEILKPAGPHVSESLKRRIEENWLTVEFESNHQQKRP